MPSAPLMNGWKACSSSVCRTGAIVNKVKNNASPINTGLGGVSGMPIACRNIHGPNAMMATPAARSLGTKLSDISCTWVTTCRMLTTRPTSIVNPSTGRHTRRPVQNRSATSFIARSPCTPHSMRVGKWWTVRAGRQAV